MTIEFTSAQASVRLFAGITGDIVSSDVLDGTLGTLFSRPATEATIWVNGFYTGDPVAVDIFPPPRPSPDSLLAITKPIDADAEFNVDSAFSVVDDSHVRVSFSASPRQVEVTGAGEMKWEHSRAYTGRWYVGWSPE